MDHFKLWLRFGQIWPFGSPPGTPAKGEPLKLTKTDRSVEAKGPFGTILKPRSDLVIFGHLEDPCKEETLEIDENRPFCRSKRSVLDHFKLWLRFGQIWPFGRPPGTPAKGEPLELTKTDRSVEAKGPFGTILSPGSDLVIFGHLEGPPGPLQRGNP